MSLDLASNSHKWNHKEYKEKSEENWCWDLGGERLSKEGGRCDVAQPCPRAGGRGSITQGGSFMII